MKRRHGRASLRRDLHRLHVETATDNGVIGTLLLARWFKFVADPSFSRWGRFPLARRQRQRAFFWGGTKPACFAMSPFHVTFKTEQLMFNMMEINPALRMRTRRFMAKFGH
jgi:hypothetical protein